MTTQEKIRSLAIRSGLAGATGTQVPMHKLEAFAALLLDEENEACAVEVDKYTHGSRPDLVKEIRARRKP